MEGNVSFCYGHTREYLFLALASKEQAGRQLARMSLLPPSAPV